MKRVIEYDLKTFGEQASFNMPRGAKFVGVDAYENRVFVRALVDTTEPNRVRTVFSVLSGYDVQDQFALRYVGTVRVRVLPKKNARKEWLHIFDCGEREADNRVCDCGHDAAAHGHPIGDAWAGSECVSCTCKGWKPQKDDKK